MAEAAHDITVDLRAIDRWLDSIDACATGTIKNPRLLAGGTQNIVMRFSRGGQDYVLRHPPANPRANSNKLLEREITVLRAIEGSGVAHPQLIAGCTDMAVVGAVFYVMAAVDGFNPTIGLSSAAAVDLSVRHRMGLELMDALASLGHIDPFAVGLDAFGKLDAFLERQVERWRSELAGYARYEGWEGPAALGDVDAVGRWLNDNCPTTMKVGIIHGDYHIGNGIFGDDGELRAVVDWEMATLGDPLVDLGRILLSWPDERGALPQTMRVSQLDGFPSRDEMIARYAERSGRSLESLPWFEVLACYKLALILEGSHARAQAGLVDRATGERLHRSAVALMHEARTIIART